MVNLHFILLVHLHIHYYTVRCSGIITLHNVYIGILVAFVCEIPLSQYFGAIHHIGRQLVVLHQAHLLLQVIALILPDARIVNLRDTGPLRQLYMQVG